MASRALVVDDDDAIVEMLRLVLELEGYDVLVASAVDALDRIRSSHPDLILLDVMMPVKDGLELLREIRSEPTVAGTPVVLVSAMSRDVDVWSGWMAGADAYVNKPVDVDALLREIARIRGGERNPSA